MKPSRRAKSLPTFVELIHVGGEVRIVDIVEVGKNDITVAWPMCGHYRIRLLATKAKNSIREVGLLLRAPQWRVKDLDSLKRSIYGL